MKILFVFLVSIFRSFCQNSSGIPVPKVIPPDYNSKPINTVWPGEWNGSRYVLGDWLLAGCWKMTGNLTCQYKEPNNVEYEGYDGWYNNIAREDSGAIDRPLLRRWPAAYEDGSYEPAGSNRPNPLVLSERLLKGEHGTTSETGKNALIVFFGQQVVEEILDAQRAACPPEYFNIPIPENHTYRSISGHTVLPFLRTRYDQRTGYSPNNPRQQINEITPYLDGGLFYGITKQWADQLRTYENGTIDPDGCLASSYDGLFPAYNTERLPLANPPPPIYHSMFIKSHETAKVSRFFKLGNPRGNENSFLLTFGIMWFRWHNYLAKRIRNLNPSWSSDKVFNEARKWVIATQQKIVVYDWLPLWISLEDGFPPYEKYDPGVDPQIDQFFQAAAFRFGHTLVVPGVYLRDYIRNGCKYKFETWGQNTVRTCNSFWRPYEPIVKKEAENSEAVIDIDRILMGMSSQSSEKEDHKIVEDLRENVFGPLEFPRRDLMALNIQRGRDHGIPDYNTVREAFGLTKKSFDSFRHLSPEISTEFKSLYNNSNSNIDLWVGGILETNGTAGELFKTIILDQFLRIRNGDRFWFENKANKLFSAEEIERIKSITIYDIIMAVTKLNADDIPKNPFNTPHNVEDAKLIKACKINTCIHDNCFLPPLTQEALNETCVQGTTYDYFANSEISYILTFTAIGAFIAGSIGVIFLLIKIKEDHKRKQTIEENKTTRHTLKSDKNINYPLFIVNEWLGFKTQSRRVVVVLKEDKKVLEVRSPCGSEVLRALDFSIPNKKVEVYQIKDAPFVIIKCTHDYDLVLKFESDYLRESFLTSFDPFVSKSGLQRDNITSFNLSTALKKVTTKQDRQELLERFYRVVFAQAFKIDFSKKEILNVDDSFEKDAVNTELTINEFAESMSMRPKDEFVRRMFSLIDKDKNGFISFREFVDLLIIFANGTELQKAKLLFDMYDINAAGYLTEDNFLTMLKSFLATVGGQIEDEKLQMTIQGMIEKAGLGHKKKFDFNDFVQMVGKDIKNLSKAKLNFRGVPAQNRVSYLEKARDTIENIYESRQEIQARLQGAANIPTERDTSKIIDDNQEESIKTEKVKPGKFAFVRYIELKSKEIFWLSLYTLVLWAIFIERAYYYSVEREHSGLRRIAGYGVTVTRGAASAMMFTYSSLLITMCRNTITILRDTAANKYFPFDASVEIHKYIALWAFIFTVMHIVGHAFNFYHIATQTSDDLTCLFRNFFHATHEIPKFHYWCWQTITGFTGVILTLIWALMYIFAQNIVRRKLYNWFWYTHNMYPLFFIFMVLHGTGRLIQPPFFYYFFLGPVVLFAVDSLISTSRKKIEIPVIRVEILPSNVTMLEIRKPENFQYKSGQWVRIACVALNKNEYHPFTLSSSPNETSLTLHIRAVGPWTTLIRTLYDNMNKSKSLLPKLYLDGPFGEGHQDWNKFDISILIGGGIGVTPFASILKDVVFKSNNQIRCKKVYFIWVSRNQKQFEWLVDLIRDLEYQDTRNVISCHIFITQFFEKFDLRTIFLYICETHYQRVSNRSLFTNLKAVTHFGRPNFERFFANVASLHESVHSIGVFSCGPPSMTSSVDSACNKFNALTAQQRLEHHFKNF